MRFSIFICTLALSSLASGCVAQHRYDAVVRERDGEQARRVQAEADLARVNAALSAAEAEVERRERALAADQTALAESKLLVDRTTTERDDAAGLVEQLRGELARAGSNLREYSDQKADLEKALGDAEARARRLDDLRHGLDDKLLLMRDLSRAVLESGSKDTAVAVVNGYPVLRFKPATLFDPKSDIEKDKAGVLRRVAEILVQKKDLKVELEDLSGPGVSSEDRIARLEKVTSVLSGGGVGFERLGVSVPGEGEAAPSPYREGAGTIELAIQRIPPPEPIVGSAEPAVPSGSR